MDKELNEIIELFLRVCTKYGRCESLPKNLGTGELLYKSEISTIRMIGNNPEINITQLADKTGVTKGAISQIISRLENKRYVARYKDANNDKEVKLRLSDKGAEVFTGYENFQKRNFESYYKIFKTASKQDIETFKLVLNTVENNLDEYLNADNEGNK